MEEQKDNQTGVFTISPGKDVLGELCLNGPRTSLYLHDRDHFSTPYLTEGRIINGILREGTKITLIDCIPMSSGRRAKPSFCYEFHFPHFVVYGDHIPSEKNVIGEVHLVVDDAPTLFYDFDAFGSVLNPHPFIQQIANANRLDPEVRKFATGNRLDSEIRTGPAPVIIYFTGKLEIVVVETVVGSISAFHVPTYTGGGSPTGVWIKNTICVSLTFKQAATFSEAMLHTLTLLRFFTIVAGRGQNLLELHVRLTTDQSPLKVYWSMLRRFDRPDDQQKPGPGDLLLDAIQRPTEFSSVLANWIAREITWRDARVRFFDSFVQGTRYHQDRLIASANMFDILPSAAVPPDISVPSQVQAVRDCCRDLFRALPDSLERSTVLNALGRVGKSSLKQKIRYRAQRLVDTMGDRLPELLKVTDEAVNCRNHYVHGTEGSFNYYQHPEMTNFLTDTLEFVFAASDLAEAGWNVAAWAGGTGHAFGAYRHYYMYNLRGLKALL